MKSSSEKINHFLQYIGTNALENIETFMIEASNRKYTTFYSEDQIELVFNNYISEFYANSTIQDTEAIKIYTGISYIAINSFLRGTWDYSKNGIPTEEKREESEKIANNLYASLMKTPDSLPQDIITYRGVNILSFKDYNIESISELTRIVGEYYFEYGFTSTSLLKEKSYFDRELEYHDKCNIEIEYFIPKECNEGLPLINDYLSYCKFQNEFLINKNCFSKIVDVKISEDNEKAYLKAMVIPRRVWDLTYTEYHEIKKRCLK